MSERPIEAAIRTVYPKISQKKLGELLDALEPFLTPSGIAKVATWGSRGAVETIEAHGLLIEVDAVGRAATVEFPEGAEILETY